MRRYVDFPGLDMKRTLLTILWIASGAGLAWGGDAAALAARLRPLLPTGTTLDGASSGFREQRDFLAAVHAAHNLNIPFCDMKTQIVGRAHPSLAQAIRALRPAMSMETVKLGVKRAEIEARHDLNARAAASTEIVYRVSTDPALANQVTALLPPGLGLEAAAAGFRDQSQFLGALRAAHEMKLPFDSIQEQIEKGQSLDQAIAAVRSGEDTAARSAQ
jgi:hypothetical protein